MAKYMTIAILLILVFSITVSAESSNDLLAHYSFSGNSYDEVNRVYGAISGASLTEDRFGRAESAFYFDGNDTITFPNMNLNIGTISLWFKAYSLNSYMLFSQYGPGWQGYIQYYSNQYRFYAPGNYFTVNWGNLATENWYNIVLTANGTIQTAYLNGVEVSSVNSTSGLLGGTGSFYIGGSSHGYYFNGNIDDIYIYNKVLSSTEIDQLYNSSPVPEPGSLILLSIAAIMLIGLGGSKSISA